MRSENESLHKSKILVIDDEIFGPSLHKIKSLAKSFFDDLEDDEQEVYQEFAQFLDQNLDEYNISIDSLIADPIKIKEIIFSKNFRNNASSSIKSLLNPVFNEYDRLKEIQDKIIQTFPEDNFEIIFQDRIKDEHKEERFVSSLSLIIIDLFLFTNNYGGGDDDSMSTSYLDSIALYKNLPPIILISTRFNSVNTSDLAEYFKKTKLSATGLTPLSKNKIISNDFGVDGLLLTYKKMRSQRDISNLTKEHINTWRQALERTKDRLSETLWKLDAYMIQNIYNDANSDKIPFEELLNSLLTRELLWHIEGDRSLRESVTNLENQLAKDKDINLFTYTSDIKSHRDLLGHYFHLGGIEKNRAIYDICVQDNYTEDLSLNILQLLPFGAVLKPKSEDKFVYINITQQCDLADFRRAYISSGKTSTSFNSILLAKSDITRKNISECIEFNSNSYVSIIELDSPIESDEVHAYDISPEKAKLISSGLTGFKELVVSEELELIGQLRADIADAYQKKIALQLLRPSQQRINRIGTKKIKIFLKINKNIHEYEEECHVILKGKNKILIPSRFCLDITLWFKKQVPEVNVEILNTVLSPDLAKVCNTPLTFNEQEGQFYYKFKDIESIQAAAQDINGEANNGKPKLHFYILNTI
ncbi:hypothetical protein [Acinetobacter lactucae]|uniref:hypothetical protein n=1 Tax=Acinetobacter lactucae TaxID=1785128 RepID=UPI0003DFAE73|nr:hypothetical protein [Acinetobacter lactucae]ETR93118.1 hypothetical protein M211_3469 [Acinetobacter lactucae]